MNNLIHFPDIDTLKRRMQSLATLDALLSPEWEFRYFSFDKHWGAGEMMGSIRNGPGDDVFALFADVGCFIKEFYHEEANLIEAYSRVPVEFLEATREPAFSPENVTTCYWRSRRSDHWEMSGNDGMFDPSASFLLALIDGKPETYESFVKDYFERSLPSDLVTQIFDHQALKASNLDSFAYAGKLEKLKMDIKQIGYPSALP
jgi:hypothetical protein